MKVDNQSVMTVSGDSDWGCLLLVNCGGKIVAFSSASDVSSF